MGAFLVQPLNYSHLDSAEPLPSSGSQSPSQVLIPEFVFNFLTSHQAREGDATKLRQLWATYPQIRDENVRNNCDYIHR